MARKRPIKPHSRPTASENVSAFSTGHRELIILTESDAELQLAPDGFRSSRGIASGLSSILGRTGVAVTPLFDATEDRVRARLADLPESELVDEMPAYYHVEAPDDQLDELAEQLQKLNEVAAAYVKPAGEPPVINDMAPSTQEAPSATPDFSARQIYLNAAPVGIDARYAWGLRGGRGNGVRIIDCEWGWRFGHEDLSTNQGGVVCVWPDKKF